MLPMDLMIDAKSVYDSVSTSDPKATTDRLMLIHVLKLRELLALKVISRLLWLDTRDMLADGLKQRHSVTGSFETNVCFRKLVSGS